MKKPTEHRLLNYSIELLELIASTAGKINVQSLSKKTGLSYSTCYRIVRTYLNAGWLIKVNGSLKISSKMVLMLDSEARNHYLIQKLQDSIKDLVERTGLTVKLSSRSNNDAVSFFREESHRPTAISSKVGARYHLAAGSSGAVLLSNLQDHEIESILKTAPEHYWHHQSKADIYDRINHFRTHNYCLDNGDFYPDLRSISTGIKNNHGTVIAAMTCLGFSSDFSGNRRGALIDHILSTTELFNQTKD